MRREYICLSTAEKIDGLFVLACYLTAPILVLGWLASLVLFFTPQAHQPAIFLVALPFVGYQLFGNQATFLELGSAALLDGNRRILLLPLSLSAFAQSGSAPAQTAGPPAVTTLPFRFELGGYYTWADRGYGNWRGLDAALWLRGNAKFIPGFLVDSQTRPTGTQQNYAFTSYMNWTQSFYTVQGVSGAPQRSPLAIYFPKSVMTSRVIGSCLKTATLCWARASRIMTSDSPVTARSTILAPCTTGRSWLLRATFSSTRASPATSGALQAAGPAVRDRRKVLFGLMASGGRELYYYAGLSPVNVRLSSFTANLFYRRWISRHMGYVAGTMLEDKLDAYVRPGVSARMFFEF